MLTHFIVTNAICIMLGTGAVAKANKSLNIIHFVGTKPDERFLSLLGVEPDWIPKDMELFHTKLKGNF